MGKKLLFLVFLLFFGQIKPFFLEGFAAIGFVACCRNKVVQELAKYACSKIQPMMYNRVRFFGVFAEKKKPRLEVFDKFKKFDRIHHSIDFGKKGLLIGYDRVVASLVSARSRAELIKQSCAIKTLQQRLGSLKNYRQSVFQSVDHAALRGQKVKDGVHVDVHNMQFQKVSGFFPRITNNFHTGDSKLLAEEIGRRKFWQGACVGSVGTAWLLKQSGPADQEKKQN